MRPLDSLTFRLFLSHLLAVALVVLGLGAYTVQQVQVAYLDSLERGLEDQATILADAIAPVLAARGDLRPILALFDDRTSVRAIVVDPSGVLLGSSEPEFAGLVGTRVAGEGLDRALGGASGGAVRPGTADLVYFAAPVKVDGNLVGAVRVSYTVAELQEQIDAMVAGLGLGLVGAAGVSVLLALSLAYRLGAPARSLAAAANALAEGDLSQRTRVQGRDEMAMAAQAFDRMAERLQQLQDQRRHLLMTVSHEIHSTITGMSMAGELLDAPAALDHGARGKLLTGLRTNIQRLKRLADDLLQTARVTSGNLTLNFTTVEPERLVRETAAAFQAEAIQRGVLLEYEVAPGVSPLEGDYDRLGQCLGNLVENALRYTPPGRRVALRVRGEGGYCLFSVIDEGEGAGAWDPGELPERDRERGRLGLGLTIVRQLVKAHGGSFSLETSADGGTRCSIRIPRRAQPAVLIDL